MTTRRIERSPTRRQFAQGALGGAATALLSTCAPTRPDDRGGLLDAWATGGTAAMTMKHAYPDPFAAGVALCPLVCETMAGPCTAATVERQDISEGLPGLPVRLALLVVAADTCAPLADARVEVWHTQRAGVYSGDTPGGAMCNRGDPEARERLYFRGTQRTSSDGRVEFDTCYPGWYPGRAVHIHLRVYLGEAVHATLQLFFADALNAEIYARHPEYAMRGQPDITNETDFLIRGEPDLSNLLFTTARMPDGAMLASKVLAIRPSLSAPACQTVGGDKPLP